jgi:hypothetical protein
MRRVESVWLALVVATLWVIGVRDGCGVGASCMGCVVEEVERDWVAVGFLPCWSLLTRMEGAGYEKGTLIRPKGAGF